MVGVCATRGERERRRAARPVPHTSPPPPRSLLHPFPSMKLVAAKHAPAAGGLVTAVFLAIRVGQAATATVLAVEAGVAAAILALTVAVLPAAVKRPCGAVIVAAIASLLAYAGLAL